MGPQLDGLLQRRANAQHQSVELADLDAALPDRGQGVGEPLSGSSYSGQYGVSEICVAARS